MLSRMFDLSPQSKLKLRSRLKQKNQKRKKLNQFSLRSNKGQRLRRACGFAPGEYVSIINTRAQEQTEQELCVEARAFARVKVSARRGCLHVYLLIGVTNTRRYNLYPRARAAM